MYNRIWRPPRGVYVSKGSTSVHGLSHAMVMKRGIVPTYELSSMRPVLAAARKAGIPIVAFNARFDCRMLDQTARAHGLTDTILDPSWVTCTYTRSRPYSPLLTVNGKRKGFANSSLYEFFFKCQPDVQLHDAFGDVCVTEACYRRGREKRWW